MHIKERVRYELLGLQIRLENILDQKICTLLCIVQHGDVVYILTSTFSNYNIAILSL